MKKLWSALAGILLIVIIIIMILGRFGFGFGTGSGESGEGSGMTGEHHPAENIDESSVEDTEQTEKKESTIIEISVAKSEYFYENKSIKLEDLVDIIQSTEGEFVVSISDDNAALKAYNKLLGELEKLGIHYIEENIE